MIVGYTFCAEQLCPECTRAAMGRSAEYEGWELAPGVRMTVEDDLSEVAAAFGIDRDDESSFDSGNFPKVITLQMAEHDAGWGADMTCGGCFVDLLELADA